MNAPNKAELVPKVTKEGSFKKGKEEGSKSTKEKVRQNEDIASMTSKLRKDGGVDYFPVWTQARIQDHRLNLQKDVIVIHGPAASSRHRPSTKNRVPYTIPLPASSPGSPHFQDAQSGLAQGNPPAPPKERKRYPRNHMPGTNMVHKYQIKQEENDQKLYAGLMI